MVTLDARDVDGTDFEATLPPIPLKLQEALGNWKSAYSEQDGVRSHFRIKGGRTKDRSVSDTINFSISLREEFNDWLRFADRGWIKIREKLVSLSRAVEQPRLILDLGTDDTLKRLPWQDWSLLSDFYPDADAALRAFNQSTATALVPGHTYPQTAKIRILVVVGESEDINTDQDLQSIQDLEKSDPNNVEVISLLQPTPKILQTTLDDPLGYHILIYVGHSRSSDNGQVGWLRLNQNDELSVSNFKFALKRVALRGLQLVIFNSCDGLGLAQQLAEVDVPRCIVMKEPVPDEVAVEFLERFFYEFATKKQSLLAAIRAARYGLEHYNFQYSEVTWLPTVCTKQHIKPLTWQLFLDNLKREDTPILLSPPPRETQQRKWVLAIGAAAAVLLGAIALAAIPPIRCQFTSCSGVSSSDSFVADDLVPAERLMSAGETRIEGSIQLSGAYETLKQQGIGAFAGGRYEEARDTFAQIRDTARATREEFINSKDSPEYRAAIAALKDPEVLIYQNNAEVRLRHAAGEQIYTIAAAIPLTAQTSEVFTIGREMLYGIAQAQDKAVNAESSEAQVNLEVVIANDRNIADQAVALAENLTQFVSVNGQGLLAVVGHYTSESTCEALKNVYGVSQLVVISPLSTLADLRRDCGGSNFFFRTTSSTRIEAGTLVQHLVNSGQGEPGSQVAIFYTRNEPYSEDMLKEFQSSLVDENINIPYEFDLSEDNFNASEALATVQDVDALIVIPDGRNSGSAAFDRAVDVIRLNRGEKMILGSNPLYTGEVITPGGGLENLKDKLFIATDWHSRCAPNAFVEETEQVYWFGRVNRTAVLPYEAVQVLLAVLEPEITSQQIRQELSALATGSAETQVQSEVFDPIKTITFDEDGDRRELTERILTTVGNNPNDPFIVVNGRCP